MKQAFDFAGAARLQGRLLAIGVLAVLSSCGSGGGGGASSGFVGDLLDKPASQGGGPFFVDPNRGGGASRLHLAEMFWGRLVDIHQLDPAGVVDPVPVFRDFVINDDIQSDGINYLLETNPITQKTRLVVRRHRDDPDLGLGDFEFLVRNAASGLSPIAPKNDDGTAAEPFSFMARNGAVVMRFDDVLRDDDEAALNLVDTVRILTGYAASTEGTAETRQAFPARLLFDPNYGAIVESEFHSTRVVVDMTISNAELPSMPQPQPVNAVGLPASLTSRTDANVSIRIPSRTNFGNGQFELLRSFSGVPLSLTGNGPVDSDNGDIVRAMRSGNPNDLNNGFLLDLNPPELLGGWSARMENAADDPQGRPGLDFVIDLVFTSVCRTAPEQGDVLSLGTEFFEVSRDGVSPGTDGRVGGLRVRTLLDEPLTPAALLGNATFLSTFDPNDPVPAGCWVSFTPLASTPPAIGVPTSAQILARFSEPMDPASISSFDTFFLVRGDANVVTSATNLVVGSVSGSTDLKDYTYHPLLPLAHELSTSETYHLEINGPTDLAGNGLLNRVPPIEFILEPDQPSVRNGGTVLRFNGPDELQPIGLNDLRGQFFFDLDRGLIRPRPVTFTGYPADRVNPVPSIMIPFPQGVQTPLTPLGSKLQTVWRYCDLGWQILDETKYNLDVFGLSWAPIGGNVISDNYEQFEIALSHSRRQPDEKIDRNLLPKYTNSGLLGGPSLFTDNILLDPLSPQKVVHPRNLGYQISAANLFQASSGTVMLPFPLNRNPGTPVTYTWRDTAVLAKGGPSGVGIPLEIEFGQPLQLETAFGYVAPQNQVPSFGLPLLMEYRCFPSDTGIGLNALDVSLAINSSAIPSFRAYSSGGFASGGTVVLKNPDQEPRPTGGYNPGSNPPGNRTARSADNTFYVGQLDAVTRISRVHTVWINSGLNAPDYRDPIVLPDSSLQPDRTEIVLEYRGATGFTDPLPTVDEGTFPFDSSHVNPYGDVFYVGSDGKFNNVDMVQFLNGVQTWVGDIDSVDGARYIQIRMTFVSDILTGLSPELSALGIAYVSP